MRWDGMERGEMEDCGGVCPVCCRNKGGIYGGEETCVEELKIA